MRVALWVLILTLVASVASSQPAYDLSGVVKDGAGAVVPMAQVHVRPEQGDGLRTTFTDPAGIYRVDGLLGGVYLLEVRADGFTPFARTLRLEGATTRIDVTLEPAGVSEVVVVTANRTEIAAGDIPQPVSVVSGETLAERPGLAGIQGLLAEVPGVGYARSGSLGGQIVFRGFNSNSNRSVLAVDGDRFRGRSTLEFNLFDPNAIDHLEVVRGPASAAYGADAMNGVVNIFTQRSYYDPSRPFRLVPRLQALDFNSNGGGIGVRLALVGGGRGSDVFLGGSLRRSDDYRTPLGEVANSDFVHRGLDARIGYTRRSARWEVAGRWQRTETGRAGGIGGAPGAPLREVREDPMTERFVRLGFQNGLSRRLFSGLDGSLYARRLQTEIFQTNRTGSAATVWTHTAVHTPTIWGGRLFASKSFSAQRLTYGVEFFDELGSGRLQETIRRNPVTDVVLSQTPPTQAERGGRQTNVGLLLNSQWTPRPRLSVSSGIRWDWLRSSLESTPVASETLTIRDAYARNLRATNRPVTGSIGTVIRVAEAFDVTGNWSRSFRVPTTGERVGQAGTILTLPSPELKPEHSNTPELGARWHTRRHGGTATVYRSDYSGLIQLVPVTATQRQSRNVGVARIEGLELDGRSRLTDRWSLRHSLAATRGTNRTTGVPLPGIAPLSGRASLRYAHGRRWHAEASIAAFKGTTRIDPAQERRRPGYAIVDLYAAIPLDRWVASRWGRWQIVPGVTNVFDKAARNPASTEDVAFSNTLVSNPLYEPGRSFVVKLTASY